MKLAIAAIWIICAIVSFGAQFAFMQREYRLISNETKWQDFTLALVFSITGPVNLVIALYMTRLFKHGFKYNLRNEGIDTSNIREVMDYMNKKRAA